MSDSILDWFEKQVAGVQRKFADDKDKPVYFSDYENQPLNVWIEIYPGCWTKFYDRTVESVQIDCKMTAGTTLPIHHHPDCIEIFIIKKGTVTDLESMTTISEGDEPMIFNINISHTMRCDEDCNITIKCNKI